MNTLLVRHIFNVALVGFVYILSISTAHAEMPVVFWHSQPVKPNATVMVQGHGISTTTLVDAQRLDDSAPGSPVPVSVPEILSPMRIAPLSFGEGILNFVVPANWQNGVFAYRLVNDLSGKVNLVNAPEPWFAHGDEGSRATPGGWVEINGNVLSMLGGIQRLSLVQGGVEVVQLVATNAGNSYMQHFDLPLNLPTGDYAMYVHNGYGGPAAWSRLPANETLGSDLIKVVPKSSLWETTARYPQNEIVVDFTAGNGGAANWDDVFTAAFARVKSHVDANNKPLGGVIRIKPGVYKLDKYFVLPDKTILAGNFGQKDATVLEWGSSAVLDPSGRNPLIKGEVLLVWPETRGTFSVEDLTLARTSANRLGLCIERALTRTDEQSAWFRRMSCREPNTAEAAIGAINAGEPGNYRAAFFIWATKNTEISDSIIDTVNGITLYGNNSSNDYVRIKNNTIRWRISPMDVVFGLKNLVYSDNTELMLGTETSNGTGNFADVGTSIGSFGHNNRDVYFANNQLLREGTDVPYAHTGITLDGNAGVYLGKIFSVSGTTVILSGLTSPPYSNLRPRNQTGAIVQILSGKGAGQWRHLISPVLDINNAPVNVIQVDRPWDVDPDATSWISINDYQGRMIFYGNNLDNAPKLQMYYASNDVIVAENVLSSKQNPVIPVWVGYRGGLFASMTHGWHYQVLDNVSFGNRPISMPTVITSLDKGETLSGTLGSYPGYSGSYVSTHIYRENHNNSSPSFEIGLNDQNAGFLVEQNTGLSALVFPEPHIQQEIGLIRNNVSPEGNRPQINEPSGYHYPTYPGSDVTLSYTDGNDVNLARSGLSTASNDCCWWGRGMPVDGLTGTLWASNQVGSTGTAGQPWFQIDLRNTNVIKSVKIWPRLDPNFETADVWVLVSPTPFVTNDLYTERARPEVFSQYLAGKFTSARSVNITNVQGGEFLGRYVRVWKSFLPGTGDIQLSEIEVYGH